MDFLGALGFVALTIVFALFVAICDVLCDLLILVEFIGGTVAGIFDNKKLAKKHKNACKKLICKQGEMHNRITGSVIEIFKDLCE